MSSLQKKLLTSDMYFQTCGQIMVAAKHNTYAMSCNFCQQKFAQIQTFMRHLQMLHTDRVEFGEKDKDVEVYAVEELMNTFSQTPTEEDCQSEESGVVEEEEDDNWLTEEDKKWLDEGEMMERDVIKGKGLRKGLQNMSILRALEDCDVTMNFGDNLENTVIEEEGDKEYEEGVGKGEDKEGDCVLNNTLLQEIQQDWNASDEDSRENGDNVKDLEDLEADVTMTEDCEEIKTDLRTKSSGLKGLLQGLEDLEDVDSLLDNLEDTVRENPSDIKKPKVINLLESGKKSNKTDSILETTAMDDLNFTFRVNEKVPKEDNVVNFKLTKKSLKKLPKVNKNLNKSQQKMLINVHTGELEEVESDSQPSEDSLDSENSAFENFKRKNNENLEYDPEDSIMEEIKMQLNKPKEGETTEKRLINNFLETKTKKLRKNSKISTISQEQKENSDLEDFDSQLKSIQESLEDEDNNSEDNSEHIADNTDSNDTLDFDLQLKNLEASLNEENNDNIKSTAKINTDFKISQNPDKYSKMRPTNLMKILDLELSANEEDLLKENSKEMDKKSKMQAIGLEILKKKLKSSKIEEHCDDKSKNSKEFTTSKGNSFKISKSKEINFSKNNCLKSSKELSSSKDFNKDLTKALSDALEGDDIDLFNFGEDNEPPLNQNLQDLLTQELMEEDSREEAIKQSTNLNIKEVSKKKVQQKVIKSPTNDCSKSRYSKTNLKAKNKQQTTLKSNDNLKSHFSTTQTSQITFQTSEGKQNLKHLENKSLSQNSFKPKKPKNFKENEVNLQVNLNPGLRNITNQENLTPVFIKKIKKEKFTPLPSFINTERGDKTPLRHEEIFLKNSPQTLEKNESLLNNFTPTKGETTPNTKEKIFLKQSPKTQGKQGELIKNKTPKTLEKSENVSLQRNPKTPGKLNNITNQKMSQNVINFSPQKSTKNIIQNYSKISPLKRQVFLSPSKSNKENSKQLTPQKIKNMAIKLPKLTPEKLKNLQKTSNYSKNLADTKKSPLNAENKTQFNNFKLPNGITLTKVSPSNNKLPANQLKPSPSSLSKQNPPNIKESQQPQANIDVFNLILNRNVPDLKTSLVKPLKQQNTQSKLRQRKASIDIVPHTQRSSHQASLAKPTPKLNNLDYKSYAVNRSARKKEVLQRMRHVKKQIFKSIENSEEITNISKINSSNLNKLNEKLKNLPNLQIKNVPKHQFDDFKKPSTISPKNLNDDEKQAKKSLNVPISSSPINDDEKLMKKSLKRPAISPIQGDQAKRHQKSSPFMKKSQNGNQSSELETTKLDLSESVVDFLESDLKRTRLNVASFLNEDFPTDDNTPNKTSKEPNENHKKIQDKQKDTNTIDSGNILDDLLSQVDNEQKISDEKTPANETTNAQDCVIDFDEARDINLLNKFGLKIIKNAEIEDVMPFEEIEQSQEKAKNFAEIYRYYQRIWCSKNGENPNLRQELDICFKQMLTQANQIFNLELSMIDIKRLVNLISLWYVQNFNSKLIEKKNISEATNRFLQIFSFIPKTVKRFYYCEYCDECFTTEHKYFTHRIVHTGAQYPYSCSKCSMGFKILKMSKTHEQQCTIQNKNTASKSEAKNTASHLKCPVCKEIFVTSKLLYEHSKTHLKTVYNCVKCELVFASATDVQKHMTLCNRNIKRIPKQYTPRPSTTKSKIETYFLNKAKLKFNKCGEIWAADKFQVFATICSYCPAQFTKQQEFLKHLQQQHGDEVILEREKDIKMNGTEECTLDEQQSIVEDNMSKESGWTEDGEIEDDKKNATVNDQALEEYDVSTNLLNNLNKTDCEEPNKNVLSNSIQNEKDEDNFDITMTEPCITSTRIEPNSDNIKSSGLKDLLEGLNDMQDLDGLLENFEESLIEMPIEHNDPEGEKLTMNAKKTENDENLKNLDANLELKDNIFKELDTFEKDLQIRNSQDAVQKDAEISTEVEEIQILEETLNPQTITNFNKSLENSEQLLNNFLNSHASLKSSTLKDNLKDTEILAGQNLVKELEQHLNNPINSNTSLKTTKLLNNLKDSLKTESQNVVKELKDNLNQETHTTLNNSLNNNEDFPPLKKFFNDDLIKALEEALEDNLSFLNDSALSRSLQNFLAQALKEDKIEPEKTNTSNSMENKEPILTKEVINPLGSLTNHKTNQNFTLKDSFEPTEQNEKTGQQNRLAHVPMEKDNEPEVTKESINTLNDSFPAIEEEVTTGKQNLLTHVPMEEDIEPEISKESINTIDSMINKQNLSLKDSFKSIEGKEKTGQKNVFAQELIEAETDQEMSKESINTTDPMINKQNLSLKDSLKSIEEKETTGQQNMFAPELMEAETDQEMSKESLNTTDSMINKQNLSLIDSLKSIEEKETTGQQNMFAQVSMEAKTDQEMSKESTNTSNSIININNKEHSMPPKVINQLESLINNKTSQNLTSNDNISEKDETVKQNSLVKEELFVANSSEDLTLGQIIDQHKTHILASGNVEKSSQSKLCVDKYPAKSLKSTNPTKSEDQLEKYVVQMRKKRNLNTLSSKNETKTYSTESLKTEISKKSKATSEETQTNSYIFNKEKLTYPQSIKTNLPKNSSEKSEVFKTQNNPNFNKKDLKILNNIKSKTLTKFVENPQIELDNFNFNSAKNPEEYSQTLKRNIKLQKTAATENLEKDLTKLTASHDKPDNITNKTLEKSVEDTQIFKLNLRQRKTSKSGTKEISQKPEENSQILESSNKLEKKSSEEQPATDVTTIADKPDYINFNNAKKSEEDSQNSKQNIELQKTSVKEDSEENFTPNTNKPDDIKTKTSKKSEVKPQISKLNLRQRKTSVKDKSVTKPNCNKSEENSQIDQLNLKLQKTVVENYTEENLTKFTTFADKPDYINSPEKSEEHPQTLKTNIKQQKSAVKGNTEEDLTNFSPNIDNSAGIISKTPKKSKEKPRAAKLNLRQRKTPATEKSETDLIKLTSINNKSEDPKSITPKNAAEASQIIESTLKLQKTTAKEDPEEDLTKFTSKTEKRGHIQSKTTKKSEESLKMLNTNIKPQKTLTEENPKKDSTKSSSINNKPEIIKSKTLKKSKEDSQTFETKIKPRKTPAKENSEDKPDHVKSKALNKPEETPQISKTNLKQQKRRVKENPEEDLRKLNDKPENVKSKTPKKSEESSQILKTNIKQQKTPIKKMFEKNSKTFTPRNNKSEIIKSKTPKKSKETSPILKSNIKQRKTRDKQNSVTKLTNVKSITDKSDQIKSNTLKNSEETPQIVKPNLNIRKSRVKEKSAADITKPTPHLNFVNLERGDRSPFKSEELLIKQTAIAQGKNVNAIDLFTPQKDDKSIKTKEQMFLKQIIKMPGKDEVSNPATTSKKQLNTSKNRNSKALQKNIKSRERNNNIIRNKVQTTSGMIRKPIGRPKKFKALKQNLKSLENNGSITSTKTLKTLGKPKLSTPQFKKSRALQQDLKSLEKNMHITNNNIQTSTEILPKPLGRPRSSNFGKSKTLKQILKSPEKNIPITSNNIQTTSRVPKPLIRPRSSNFGKSKTFKQSLKSLQKNSPITRNKIQKTLGNPSRRSSTVGKSKSLKEKLKSPEKNETIDRNKMQKSPGILQKTEENPSVRPSNLTKSKPLKPGLQSLKKNLPIKRYKSHGNPIIKKILLKESNLKQSKLNVAKLPSRVLKTTLKSSKKAKQSIYPTLKNVVVKLRRFSLDKLREILNVSKTITIPEEKDTFLKPLKKETTKLLKITKEVEETASSSKTKRKFTPSKENDSCLNLENKDLTTSPLKMGKKPLKKETTKLLKITMEVEETKSSSKTKRKLTPSKENDSWLNLENKDLTKSPLKTGKKDSKKCLVTKTKSKESPKFLSKEKETSFKTEQDLTQSKEDETRSFLDPITGDIIQSALNTEHDLIHSKEEENDSLLDPITGEIIEFALNMEEKDPLEVPLTMTNFKENDSALPIKKEKNSALKPDNEKFIESPQPEKEEKDPLNFDNKNITESPLKTGKKDLIKSPPIVTKSKGKERAHTLSLQNKHSRDSTNPITKAKEKYSSLKSDNKNVKKSNLTTEHKSSADSTNSITKEKDSPLKTGNEELIKSLQSEKQKKDVTESPLKTKKKDSIKIPLTVTKSKGKEKDSTLSPQSKHSTHSTSTIMKAKEKKINVTKSNVYNSALSAENKFSTQSTNSITKEKDSVIKSGDNILIESLHSKKDKNESSLNSKNKSESPLEIAKKDSIKSPLTGKEKDKCITESSLKNDKKDSIKSPVTVIKSKGKEKDSTLSPPNKHSTDSTNPIIKAEEKESFLNPENINVSKSNEYKTTLSTDKKYSTESTKPITKEKDSSLMPDYEELIEFLESDKEEKDSSLKSENKYITESPLKTEKKYSIKSPLTVANSKEKEEESTLSPQNKHSTDSTKPIIKANAKDSSFNPENINVTKSNEYDSTLSTENKYSTDFTSPITKERDSSLMPDYEELIEFLAEEKDSSLNTENINVTKANEYESTLNTENNYSTDFTNPITKEKDSPLMPDYEELIEFLQSEKEEKDSSLKSENKYITESPFKSEKKDSIKSPSTVAKSIEKEEDSTFSAQNKHITGSTNPFIKAKEKDSSLNPENINVTKSNEYESTLSTENKYSTDFTNPITKGKDSPLMPDYEELIEFLQSEEEETEDTCITESPVKTEKDSIKSPLIVTKFKGKDKDSTLSPQNKQEKDSFCNPENLNFTKSNECESTLFPENKYSIESTNPFTKANVSAIKPGDKNLIESLHSKKDENDSLSNLENKAKAESPSIKENNNSLEIPLTFTESKERENYSTLSPAIEHSTSSAYQIIEEKYCHLKPYIKDLPESLKISIKAKDKNSFLYLGNLNETESLETSPNLLAEDTVNKITLNPSITCTQTEENLAKLEIIKLTKPIKSKIVTPRNNLNSKASATQKRIRKPSIAIVTKQSGLNIQTSTATQYNLNDKTYAVNRSPSKKQILKKLPRKRKHIAESVKHVEDISKSTVKEKINIENICILPRLPPEVMNRLKMSTYNNPQKPIKFAAPTKSTTTFSTTKLIKNFKPAKPTAETSTLDDKMFIEKSLKRPNTTALQGDGQLVKKPYKSPLIGDSSIGLTSTDSTEKHREAKAELMKSPGSDKILDDLLQQVINESNVNEELNTYKSEITDEHAKISYLVDFDKHADLRLLNKFGLNIIKSPNIEDTYTFEQNEKMYDKAKHFAIIFKNYQLIWNIKNVFNPNIKLELAKSFRQLLAHVKQIFDSELTMMYLRRLVNLITCWYDHYCNVKVTAKDEISDGTNRYLLMFHYMPQNLKRTYYCEYCDELTIEECEYFTHRAVHTGHQYAFRCFICSKGFKFVKQLKLHQSICGTKANKNKIAEVALKTTKSCSKLNLQKPRTYSTVNQQTLQNPRTNSTVNQQTFQTPRTYSTVNQQTLQNPRTNLDVNQQTLQTPRTNSTVTQQTLQEPRTNLTVTQQTLQEPSTTVTTNYVLCSVCFAIFETSNQLSEHTKTHLNDN